MADVTQDPEADLIISAPLLNAANGLQAASLIKTGEGTMTLTGLNTYTGDTVVNAGILAVSGNSLPDTGSLIIKSLLKKAPIPVYS